MLSFEQKQQIFEQGFTVVPGAVPQERVETALRAINHSIGAVPPTDAERIKPTGQRIECGELAREAVITDLFNASSLPANCDELLGEGNLLPVDFAQIALRYPRALGDDDPKLPMHLDGMPGKNMNNGVPPGAIQNFTMLCGIFLSDVPRPNCGNLAVSPGSHRLYEAYFREHGPESLLQGMPKIPRAEPQHVIARAGDAILCHYQVAHGIAPHFGPNIRYCIFFRLKHRDHDSDKNARMTDIWMDWPGLRALTQVEA